MKNVLILGGTGTIGQYLTELYFEKPNVNVIVTSRQTISSVSNIKYVCGNAHDIDFLKSILTSRHWTAIIDLMSYKTDEFSNRVDLLLASTEHYLYISSSRVYADNGLEPIKEDNLRLLDATKDEVYLRTDEYALAKARQENILMLHNNKNWSIVRPYITFGPDRLQLGVYEKEQWLYRVLNGKAIVFPKSLLDNFTTLTPNKDVSSFIYYLIEQENACGEFYHVTGNYCVKWIDILDTYCNVITEVLGVEMKVCYTEHPVIQPGSFYQYKYDRCFNRVFDNSKANEVYRIDKENVHQYLQTCIRSYLKNRERFNAISWRVEAVMDRKSKDFQNIFKIPSIKERLTYMAYRIFPLPL